MRIWGSRFRVWWLGFKIWGVWFAGHGLGLRVQRV